VNHPERIESLKSGIVGAIATTIAFLLFWVGTALLTPSLEAPWHSWVNLSADLAVWIGGVGAIGSGFLFGVTYRYIIRTDVNSHLKSGAVLAFGLVRGFAQVEVGLSLQGTLEALVLLATESIMMFAIARLLLDWSLQQGIVKPFAAED
jgi:hypothetical protein